MTIKDLKSMTKEVITPDEAAKVLGCSSQYIRIAARENRQLLGFPVVLIGRRVKIPRVAFINFLEGRE